MFLENMTWEEVSAVIKSKPETIAVVPLGSTEQHGTHLPIGTDTMETTRIAIMATKKATRRGTSVLVCPTLPFGATTMSMDFPGTISLNTRTLEACLKDICDSLSQHGLKKIVIMDGEGGNGPAVDAILKYYEDNRKTGRPLVVCVRWWSTNFSADLSRKYATTQFGHGSEIETSVMLALGERVLMNKAVNRTVEAPFRFISYDYIAPWKPTISHGYPRLGALTDTGATGDPTKGSKKKGKGFLSAITNRIADVLYDLYVIELGQFDREES